MEPEEEKRTRKAPVALPEWVFNSDEYLDKQEELNEDIAREYDSDIEEIYNQLKEQL